MKHKLKIEFDAEESEWIISGSADGLKYLADVCLGIIGHTSPAGHFHLSHAMGNLERGSVDTVIEYRADSDWE